MNKRQMIRMAGAAVLLALAHQASAQTEFPTRPACYFTPGTPQQFAAFLAAESRKLQALVESGVRIDVE
ncbi:hypothetical protein [Pseudorhodoferax soli]|uniref:Uncharacterized protein n=1 Tax=Pseudorhodoferax soli TaxID=545864 RepID=A0A368XQP9_9BURK|nr:hypothetical protein [Pseudorhodoferax soli]RCW70350.1 hypothetical protein DES41_105292 [Pseudorhodoferax soli]